MSTIEEILKEIAAGVTGPISFRPTHVIYIPEDIQRVAKIRGVSVAQVWADLALLLQRNQST